MRHKNTIPTPPVAWLVVTDYGAVIGVFPCRDDPDLLALVKEETASGRPVSIMLDNPSLKVIYYGIDIYNPSCLTARDNWFHRYQSVLENHLRDPRIAQVFTFSPGKLT